MIVISLRWLRIVCIWNSAVDGDFVGRLCTEYNVTSLVNEWRIPPYSVGSGSASPFLTDDGTVEWSVLSLTDINSTELIPENSLVAQFPCDP